MRTDLAKRSRIGTDSGGDACAVVVDEHPAGRADAQPDADPATQQRGLGLPGSEVAEGEPVDLVHTHIGGLQVRLDTPFHRRSMGLGPERSAQLVQTLLRLGAERPDVPGVRRETGVDLVAVVVVVEQHPHLADVLDQTQGVEGVGGHEVGEVR